jgi:hypothetical protein
LSLGRVSLLEFYFSEPRDLTLELRGFPFDDDGLRLYGEPDSGRVGPPSG